MAKQTSADNVQEFKERGKERHDNAPVLTPACVSMAAWGASLLSLSAIFPHSALVQEVKQGLLNQGAHFPLESIHCFYFALFCLWLCE